MASRLFDFGRNWDEINANVPGAGERIRATVKQCSQMGEGSLFMSAIKSGNPEMIKHIIRGIRELWKDREVERTFSDYSDHIASRLSQRMHNNVIGSDAFSKYIYTSGYLSDCVNLTLVLVRGFPADDYPSPSELSRFSTLDSLEESVSLSPKCTCYICSGTLVCALRVSWRKRGESAYSCCKGAWNTFPRDVEGTGGRIQRGWDHEAERLASLSKDSIREWAQVPGIFCLQRRGYAANGSVFRRKLGDEPVSIEEFISLLGCRPCSLNWLASRYSGFANCRFLRVEGNQEVCTLATAWSTMLGRTKAASCIGSAGVPSFVVAHTNASSFHFLASSS